MSRNQSVARRARSAAPAGEPSDRELVAGVVSGDALAFNRLYDRYFQRIYSFTCIRLRNRADAEEVVQETFTAVFRCIENYRGQSTVLAWIYGIAKNTVNNHIRRATAHERRIENAEPELLHSTSRLDACTPEEHLTLSRCEDAIRQRLESVGDWHVEAFHLRHVENLSIPEIARRVSRSNDAVRSSLYRVKKMLIQAIDPGIAMAR